MKEEIFDMLVSERLDVLEDVVNGDEEYRAVREVQIQTQKKLETLGLTEEQKEAVQDLLGRANQSGAVYGKIAFKQGFRDGVKFICELWTEK